MAGKNDSFSIDTITVSSPSFNSGEAIPSRFTCDGENINPALHFTGVPPGTKSAVLIIDDPDAPKGTFNHWLMWNIDPLGMIAENSAPGVQGKNGSGKKAYKGPCPPKGTGIHHYRFKYLHWMRSWTLIMEKKSLILSRQNLRMRSKRI